MGQQKDFLYRDEINHVALLFRTLGSSARLTILGYLLEHGSATNKELVEALTLSQSTISQHIRHMKAMNLVTATQRENCMIYTVSEPLWAQMKVAARNFGAEERGE